MVIPNKADADRGGARFRRPSEEFAAYCELEVERRLNSGDPFDEAAYRRGMALVLERLTLLEGETHR
jgi:hypothetical protein